MIRPQINYYFESPDRYHLFLLSHIRDWLMPAPGTCSNQYFSRVNER
ncbi:MAG: hypothetical protein NTW29_08015 [Bacteroidetes bacterium]|nr:hypothetical protein [Bacteroidota bacterium]